MAEVDKPLSPDDIKELQDAWTEVVKKLGPEKDPQELAVIGGEYTISFCRLWSPTYELACRQLNEGLRLFEPLLRGAPPERRFREEIGSVHDSRENV